jgi:hypothetical protein
MPLFSLVLGLVATYLTAVAGARGCGSRKLWIGGIFVGLLVCFAGMMLGNALSGTDVQGALLSGHGAAVWTLIVRVGFGFSLGSLLALLLYRNKQPDNQLGLR